MSRFHFLLFYCCRTELVLPLFDIDEWLWHRYDQSRNIFLLAYKPLFQTTAETDP